jgi:hypothetical protein
MDDDALRRAKLAKLLEIEGYDHLDKLMEAVFSDAVSAAICMNEGCDFTYEMERLANVQASAADKGC